MSTIRETMETTFAASAFAERNLNTEAQQLLQGLQPEARTQAQATQAATRRPRPTLQAK